MSIENVDNNIVIATNRGKLNINEMIIFPLISFILVGILTNFIIGIIVGLINLTIYPLLRFSTWAFYKEVELDNGKLFVLNKFLTKSLNRKLITKNFDNKKLYLKAIKSNEIPKHILQYKTHKVIDLLIIDDIDSSIVKKFMG